MKKILNAVVLMLCFTIFASPTSANTDNPAQTTTAQIPDSIKTIAELGDYIQSNGIVKTYSDYRDFMEKNKPFVQKLSPNLIDYGFTFRLYAETNTPMRDDGLIKITHDYGVKEAKLWVVPFIISNNSDEKVEISKENFALVPRYIPDDNGLYPLAIGPEYIMDGSKEVGYRKILGTFEIPPKNEVHLNAVFYVFPTTSEQSVNLRVYDGKDHTDINIAKQ
ncbi:hypothetical protein [Brevibacillus centrosporus]|uniref:hypothetical protein n=1 Tax=Brevibacillus centrosporus TaxID=54910 RepID=UPI003B02BC17